MPARVGGINGGILGGNSATIKCPKPATDEVDGGPSKESTKESTKKKRVTVADAPASSSSLIFNSYVEARKQIEEDPDWKPTGSLALQMRTNIKTLLEKDKIPVDKLLGHLKAFFKTEWILKAGCPWSAFVKDPSSFSLRQQQENPAQTAPTPAAHRKFRDREERT